MYLMDNRIQCDYGRFRLEPGRQGVGAGGEQEHVRARGDGRRRQRQRQRQRHRQRQRQRQRHVVVRRSRGAQHHDGGGHVDRESGRFVGGCGGRGLRGHHTEEDRSETGVLGSRIPVQPQVSNLTDWL